MRQAFITSAIAAAALALANTAAQADATANTSVTNLTVTLTDLDATDGISPSLNFTGFSGNTLLAMLSSTNPDSDQGQTATFTSLFGPATVYSATPFLQANGAVSGNVFAGTGSIVLSASGTGYPQFSGAGVDFSLGQSDVTPNFTLSPRTSLTISADYSVEVDTDINANYFQSMESVVFFALSGPGGVGLPAQTSSYEDYSVLGDPSQRENNSGSFSITFSNPTGIDAAGSLEALVSAGVDPGINPNAPLEVPEPTTSALLLAGLAVAGLTGRRRLRGGSQA